MGKNKAVCLDQNQEVRLANLTKEFKDFLNRNGVYKNYSKNLDVEYGDGALEWILADSILNDDADELISSAFKWDMTPEGHRFWSKISRLWEEYYETQKRAEQEK